MQPIMSASNGLLPLSMVQRQKKINARYKKMTLPNTPKTFVRELSFYVESQNWTCWISPSACHLYRRNSSEKTKNDRLKFSLRYYKTFFLYRNSVDLLIPVIRDTSFNEWLFNNSSAWFTWGQLTKRKKSHAKPRLIVLWRTRKVMKKGVNVDILRVLEDFAHDAAKIQAEYQAWRIEQQNELRKHISVWCVRQLIIQFQSKAFCSIAGRSAYFIFEVNPYECKQNSFLWFLGGCVIARNNSTNSNMKEFAIAPDARSAA